MSENLREQLTFDVERYIRLSKKVDISDLDLSQAARYPVSDEEIRALTYMTDIESHTVVYLRAILNTCAIEDPQTTAFLSCWAYEEFFHGHTLRQFLNAVGVPLSATRIAEVQKATSFFEWLKGIGIVSLVPLFFSFSWGLSDVWGYLGTLDAGGLRRAGPQDSESSPGGNRPPPGQRRAPALRLLLQQGTPAITVTKCAASHQLYYLPFLAPGRRWSETGQRSVLDSVVYSWRSPGGRHRTENRCDHRQASGLTVVRPPVA
jgi:hypothetical protein